MVVATTTTITKSEFLIGKKVDLYLVILGRVFLEHTSSFHACTRVPRTRWQLEVQNCWALRHGQAFLSASLKQKPVHVHTEISSRPAWAATSMSLSSILSRIKFICIKAIPFFSSFTVECVSWYWVGRSDWKKKNLKKKSQDVLEY